MVRRPRPWQQLVRPRHRGARRLGPATDAGAVVVGLKSRAHSEELLATAFDRATATGAPMDSVHAWKLPDEYRDRIEERTHSDSWLARGRELIEDVLAPWRADYPNVPGVVHDEPARALIHAAQDLSLLFLVRRAPGRVLGSHLGGTARAVLR